MLWNINFINFEIISKNIAEENNFLKNWSLHYR